MKIMSFNTQHCLNYLEQKIDFRLMADVIKNSGAEIVGLNEMRGEGPHPEYTDQTKTLSQLSGMEHYVFAKAIELPEGLYGNGLLSKHPIESAQVVPIPVPEKKAETDYFESRCLLKTRLKGGITVIVTHFGLSEVEQKYAVRTVVENLENEKCILMGDFNVSPENEILSPIRARMKDTAAAFKLPLMSFPSDNPDRKIDYIFVTDDIEVLTADIPEIIASDHRPHVADVKI